MRRFGVVDQRRTQEAALTRWISENPDRQKKYGEVLPSLEKAYDDLQKSQPRDSLVQQMAGFSDIFQIAALIGSLAADKEKPQSDRNPNLAMTAVRVRGALPEIIADRNPSVDRDMLTFLLRKTAELPANQKIEAVEKRFGNLQGDARIHAEEEFAKGA